jgi:hypothetical protein
VAVHIYTQTIHRTTQILVGYWNKVHTINSHRECLEMNPPPWIIDQAYVVRYTSIRCTVYIHTLDGIHPSVVRYTSIRWTVYIHTLYGIHPYVVRYTSIRCTVYIHTLYGIHPYVVRYTSIHNQRNFFEMLFRRQVSAWHKPTPGLVFKQLSIRGRSSSLQQ